MKILIDTHTFIWFVTGDNQLTATARQAIENTDNETLISIASLWEMAIKVYIGKLELGRPFEHVIHDVDDNGFKILPIRFSHLMECSSLSLFHRDPFDRLIIAQSKVEGMSIVGSDKAFDDYVADRIW